MGIDCFLYRLWSVSILFDKNHNCFCLIGIDFLTVPVIITGIPEIAEFTFCAILIS